MEILAILAVGTLNMACFLIGAKVGQAVKNGKEIQAPAVKSPITMIQEHRESKEAEKERHKLDVIMRNIECYDGTAKGQEDVPV